MSGHGRKVHPYALHKDKAKIFIIFKRDYAELVE